MQIWRVMARRGVVVDASPAAQAKVARALRSCVMCPSIDECDRWLASATNQPLESFCPNAVLLEQLRAARD